jgi:hypothetical protein
VQLAEACPPVYHPLINQILIAALGHINETVECAGVFKKRVASLSR